MASTRTGGTQGTTYTHTGVDKYPVEPGEAPWNMRPPQSVEVSFKIMEHSIDSLQEWYHQSAEDVRVTKEEKKKNPKNATSYLLILGISHQHVPGLIGDIASSEKACKSASYPGISRKSKEFDVEINTLGYMPMHMCAIECEKTHVSKILNASKQRP